MSKLVQIRDLPEDAHRILKSRAALEGKTLSAYLREELEEMAAKRTPDEVWESIRRRNANREPHPDADGAATIRAVRDEREEQMWQTHLRFNEEMRRRREQE